MARGWNEMVFWVASNPVLSLVEGKHSTSHYRMALLLNSAVGAGAQLWTGIKHGVLLFNRNLERERKLVHEISCLCHQPPTAECIHPSRKVEEKVLVQ